MKCPHCWTEKAYLREVKGWKGVFLAWLLLVPMQCHHCYHEFTVFWIWTLGKQIRRTKVKTSSSATMVATSFDARSGNAARTAPRQSRAVVSGLERRMTPDVCAVQNTQFKRAM